MNWDCHVHVFGSPDRYPLASGRRYTPSVADLAMLRRHLSAVDASQVVLVQPTVYGDDHRCLIDALEALGEAAVAVGACPEAGAPPPTHPRIVALRLDLRGSWSGVSEQRLEHALAMSRQSERHLELQIGPQALHPLAGLVAAARVPIVLDHLAGLSAQSGAESFEAFARLASASNIFVKLSALERVPGGFEAALPVARRVAALAPDRLLWGSDWPHTPLHPPAEGRLQALPFRQIDDAATVEAIGAALGTQVMTRARRDTPDRVYRRLAPMSP